MSERTEHPAVTDFGAGVDLQADGLLHLINREVFHPRGYALAFNRGVSADAATPSAPQFVLIYPDGGNPLTFADDLNYEGRSLPDLAEAAFKRASENLYEFSNGYPFTDDVDEKR